MKVGELRKALASFAKTQVADDVTQLALSLEPLDAIEVEELWKALAPAIKRRAQAESAKVERARLAAERTKNAAAIMEAAVVNYTEELDDNAAFEGVVKRIEEDRSIKIAQAQEIARRFTANREAFRSKKAAMKAVLQRQIADRRAAARSSQVSDLF